MVLLKRRRNNSNADIDNGDNSKSIKYKAKLECAVAEGANGILKNVTISVPLKYLSNFWRSLEMPLINCKVELKFKWTSYCVLSAADVMLMIEILIILFLLSKTRNFIFL